MFCIFHKSYQIRADNHYFIFYGVNEIYPKQKHANVLLEYELPIYNPFLQKRGYMETSAYLHVYWNKLYLNREMVGFSQYDMVHLDKYTLLDKNTIYLLNANTPIVSNGQWSHLMFSHLRNLDFLIQSYNAHFGTDYTPQTLEQLPLSLWQTNIYPISVFEKLCGWLEKLVEEIYPWSNEQPYETHFGSIGGYTERALSIFNAFEIYNGRPYQNLRIQHGVGSVAKNHYHPSFHINKFSQDIHTKYIANVTGQYPESPTIDFCMFRAQTIWNGIHYSCERIHQNGKNGLYFMRDGWAVPRANAFDIEGEDPRIFVANGIVYVLFICLSPYEGQSRCIGLSAFEKWNPRFLQIEHVAKNKVEKNWAPFVKNGEIHFVYNYDPLVILRYDLNETGMCSVVFTQDNTPLPLATSNTYLRGGSNLLEYQDGYFIGGCHSRMFNRVFEHYTHMVLLNTNEWRLEYVSKPVLFPIDVDEKLNNWWSPGQMKKALDRLDNLNILMDQSPNIIQDPISLYWNNGVYFMTINVRDCVSLLYEISFANVFDKFRKTDMVAGEWNEYVRKQIMSILK